MIPVTFLSILLSVPPAFGDHKFKDKMVLRAGSSAVIEIPFVGCPLPDVNWAFKGGRLPDARRFKTDVIYGMTSMTMAKVVLSDTGDYSLTITNPHGKCSLTIKVIVLGKLLL